MKAGLFITIVTLAAVVDWTTANKDGSTTLSVEERIDRIVRSVGRHCQAKSSGRHFLFMILKTAKV